MGVRVSKSLSPRPALRGALLLAAACAGMAFPGGAARADQPAARPRLVADQTELDLGLHEPGPKLEFNFRLQNTGDAPLQIKDVKPSCGCVIPRFALVSWARI